MKKLILSIPLLMICIKSVFSQQYNVHLMGNFPKYKDSAVTFSYILSSTEERFFESEEILMKNGQFEVNIKTETPIFFIAVIDKDFALNTGIQAGIPIFPNDSLIFHIKDFGLWNVDVSGTGSERFKLHNKYVKKAYSNQGHQLSNDLKNKIDYANFQANTLDSLVLEFKNCISDQMLNSYKANEIINIFQPAVNHLIKSSFNEMDEKFTAENIIENRHLKHLIELNNQERQKLLITTDYYNLLRKYTFINKSLIEKRTYVPDASVENDYYTLYSFFKHLPIRDYMLSQFLIRNARKKGTVEGIKECYKHFFTLVNSETPLYEQVLKSYNLLDNNLAKGSITPNFVLTDSIGNLVNIKDFKGKVVVLDFWFTGCGGCMSVAKHLESIKNDFTNVDIVFASVSVDKQKDLWLKGIGKFAPSTGLHYYTNGDGTDSPIIKHFNIGTFPSLIILDRDGKVFNSRASRPDRDKDRFLLELNSAVFN